jgi:hypothetical protein
MSRHTFIHIGDAHVCHAHPRNADRLAALDCIIDAGRQAPTLAAWLWPGDLFHQRSTPDDRNAVAQRLQAMAAHAPVVLTVGNHEVAEELVIFARLSAPWPIYVLTEPGVAHFRTATRAAAACFALPYPHKAGLVGAGVEHAGLGQEARALLDPIFIAAADELQQAAKTGAIPLMVGHVNVGGSIASVGQPQIGRELELDPGLLARIGAGEGTAVALNHIHRHQLIHGAVYAGSIARLDFGEREPKGYVEWEYDATAGWTWRFVEVPTPEMLHVDGVLTREGFRFEHDDWMCLSCRGMGDGERNEVEGTFETLSCQDCRGTGRRSWAGADIRCRYTFVKAETDALDVAKVLAEFAGARSLKLDPVPVLEHQVRAPEIAAAATLDEKVERYAERHGIEVTEGFRAKLAALQSQDATALLSQVSTEVARAGAVERETEQAVA